MQWVRKRKANINIIINAYIWSLEKWYWWTYFQGRNRDTDIEKKLVGATREGEGGTNWESGIETYTLPCLKHRGSGKGSCCITQGAQPSALWQPRGVRWCGGGRWGWEWERGTLGRGHMYTYGWFTMYGRDQHNIVKQLFPIRNFKKGGSDFNLCVQCLLCIVYKRNDTQAILLFRF